MGRFGLEVPAVIPSRMPRVPASEFQPEVEAEHGDACAGGQGRWAAPRARPS
jgi:hypothetical protein